jgi:hypothetical protein
MLALLTTIMAKLPAMIEAGINVFDLIQNVRQVYEENRVPSNAEWDALDAIITAAEQRAMAPQPGEG